MTPGTPSAKNSDLYENAKANRKEENKRCVHKFKLFRPVDEVGRTKPTYLEKKTKKRKIALLNIRRKREHVTYPIDRL